MRGPASWRCFRAWLTNYFWTACPMCGDMFAGFENPKGVLWLRPGYGLSTCPRCHGRYGQIGLSKDGD